MDLGLKDSVAVVTVKVAGLLDTPLTITTTLPVVAPVGTVTTYGARFAGDPWEDVPQLRELESLELATLRDGVLRLNEQGLEYSDTIGPWLYSPRVDRLMHGYALR